MYIYAVIGGDNIVQYFETTEELYPPEDFPDYFLVDAIHEDWIQRKKWDEESQQFVDVTLAETKTRNSLEFTHIDSNGAKHWLDVFVNNLASGGSVETATVSEVETYLGI